MFTNFFEKASSDQSGSTPPAATMSKSSASSKAKKKRRRRQKGNHDKSVKSSDADDDVKMAGTKRKSASETMRPQKSSKRFRPSEAALALSAKLKEYSTQKRLDDALELYWDESNDSIRDEHHACIVIDCSARCGAVAEGEKIVSDMKKSGMNVNVQAKTALLKGYAHAGMIHKGDRLFRDMCRVKNKRNRPNVRTLNTLLRGCLWTAATADESEQVAGGVVTSEASWELFRSCVSSDDLDCSSYEYFIAQLCYALRVEEAESVIGEMKRKHSLANRLDEADPSAVESLAVSLVALARAMALLTQFDEGAAVARNALQTAETAKHLLQDKNESSVQTTGSTGGKRGWKEDSSSAPRRAVSNSLFRSHRLSEVQSEASDLLSVCSLHQEDAKGTDLAFYLVTRLLYFSGGGTTDLSARVHDKTTAGGSEEIASVRGQLMNSLWHTFGLRSAIRQLSPDSDWHSSIRVFGARDCLRVQEAVGLPASIISEDGFIDFREVFRQHQDTSPDRSDQPTSQATEARPLDIELGSGFGDWIVYQAISNPQRDYVAVELRADRVSQTFSKTLLNGSSSPLSNLCCVGSDCGSFLRERVRQGSVATVFVNHPEPPTQTYGANSHVLTEIAEGGNEPAHMLSSDTLISASKCLQSNGRLIVVTDNRFYARLLCVTLVKSMKAFTGSICSTDLARCPGIRQIESFGAGRERVDLYEGQPSEAIGHTVQSGRNSGTSYFDRLWRSGAGTHAERRKRFIISMERAHGASKPSSAKNRQVYRSKEARAGNAGKSGNTSKKNRKKSEAKQKRRNERRLAKRAAGEGGTAASLFSADSLFRCGL